MTAALTGRPTNHLVHDLRADLYLKHCEVFQEKVYIARLSVYGRSKKAASSFLTPFPIKCVILTITPGHHS
jgi:hypothetical protein